MSKKKIMTLFYGDRIILLVDGKLILSLLFSSENIYHLKLEDDVDIEDEEIKEAIQNFKEASWQKLGEIFLISDKKDNEDNPKKDISKVFKKISTFVYSNED